MKNNNTASSKTPSGAGSKNNQPMISGGKLSPNSLAGAALGSSDQRHSSANKKDDYEAAREQLLAKVVPDEEERGPCK